MKLKPHRFFLVLPKVGDRQFSLADTPPSMAEIAAIVAAARIDLQRLNRRMVLILAVALALGGTGFYLAKFMGLGFVGGGFMTLAVIAVITNLLESVVLEDKLHSQIWNCDYLSYSDDLSKLEKVLELATEKRDPQVSVYLKGIADHGEKRLPTEGEFELLMRAQREYKKERCRSSLMDSMENLQFTPAPKG